MMGNAAIQAAERARDLLAEAVSRKLERARGPARVRRAPRVRQRRPRPRRDVRRGGVPGRGAFGTHRHDRLVHAAAIAPRSSRAAASGRRRPTPTPPPSSRWTSIPRPAGSRCRTSGSRTTSASALNPVLVRGQVEGSVYMGLGEALMEEQAFRRLPPRLSHALVHKFPSMLEYKSPTTLDMPEIDTDLVEDPDPERAVRRQGSRPGAAPADHAGRRQRGVRRGRRARRRDSRSRPRRS